MELKRIVVSSNTSWSLYNFRLSLMKSMRHSGCEVIAVAPYDEYSQKIINEGFEYYPVDINNQGKNPIEDIKTTMSFYKIYNKVHPDIVCQYTIKPNVYGSFAAYLLGVKAINNIAGLGTLFIKQGLTTKVAKFLYKISQSKASKVFFQNNDDYELFVNEKLVTENKCDILPGSGVDIKRFSPMEKRKKGKLKFLHISRMIWEKGIAEYIEAARLIKKKYPNVEFQLLGFLDVNNPGAIRKSQMDRWVKEGIVDYLGVSDNVKDVIAEVDCIVLASYYREGTPRTLLESASMEKPIITTDNVGCRDVVDDGINGFICESQNATDLADKIEMFLGLSEAEQRLMGKKSREKIIKEFDEEIVINKYLKEIKLLS